jgi:hypothetical protein
MPCTVCDILSISYCVWYTVYFILCVIYCLFHTVCDILSSTCYIFYISTTCYIFYISTTYYHLHYIPSSLLHTIIFTTYHHPTQSSIPILNTDIHLHTRPTQMLHGMVECPRTPPSLLNRPSPATFNPCQPQKLSYTCLTYHESTSKDDIRWQS